MLELNDIFASKPVYLECTSEQAAWTGNFPITHEEAVNYRSKRLVRLACSEPCVFTLSSFGMENIRLVVTGQDVIPLNFKCETWHVTPVNPVSKVRKVAISITTFLRSHNL